MLFYLFPASKATERPLLPLPSLFWPLRAFSGFLGFFPAFSGSRAFSGPTLNLNPIEHPLLPLPGLFWPLRAFSGFLGFFPTLSGFGGPLLGFWISSQPFLGLRASSGPFLECRPLLVLFCL